MGSAADDAGDQAGQAAPKVEALTRSLKRNETQATKTAVANAAAAGAMNDVGDEAAAAAAKARASTGWLDRLFNTIGGGGSKVDRTSKSLFGFGKVLRFALVGVKWVAIASGISFVITALKGLGAAAYAAVAGLSPLVGMFVTLPAGIAALLQNIAALKMATSGMGEALKVMLSPDATAEEIRAVSKSLTENQMKMVLAIKSQAGAWGEVKKKVGNTFFKDMDRVFFRVSKTYLPIMDKWLTKTAEKQRLVAVYAADWLTSTEGTSVINQIMADNVEYTEDLGKGMFNLLTMTAHVTRAASPMLRMLSDDFEALTGRGSDAARDNQKRLEGFFTRSYELFKDVNRVLGYYLTGLYNIGVASGVMGRWMGRSLEEIGKQFEKWSGSKMGQKDIKEWFKGLIPVVKEVTLFFRDLLRAAGAIGYSNSDFVKASRGLRQEVLPILVDFFNALTKWVIPAIERIERSYDNFKEGGVVGGFSRAITRLAKMIEYVGTKVADAPAIVKALLAFVTGLVAMIGILKRVPGASLATQGAGMLAQRLTGGKVGGGWGVQKVWVDNWYMIRGGRGGAPTGGIPGGGPRGGTAGGAGGGALANRLSSVTGKAKNFGKIVLKRATLPLALVAGGYALFDMANENAAEGRPQRQFSFGGGGALSDVPAMLSRVAELQNIIDKTKHLSVDPSTGKRIPLPQEAELDALKKKFETITGKTIPEWNAAMDTMYDPDGMEKLKTYTLLQKKHNRAMDAYIKMISGPERKREAKGRKERGHLPFMQRIGDEFGDLKNMTKGGVKIPVDSPGAKATILAFEAIAETHKMTPKELKIMAKMLGWEKVLREAGVIGDKIKDIPKNVNTTVNVGVDWNELPLGLREKLGNRFAGGDTVAGKAYIAGELGPEAWIGRGGEMKMLGLHGPEVVAPGSGAVIPASGTADPFKGSMGDAPHWAQEAYRQSVSQQGSAGGVTHIDSVSMPVHITNPASNVDVERAIQRAWRDIQSGRIERS